MKLMNKSCTSPWYHGVTPPVAAVMAGEEDGRHPVRGPALRHPARGRPPLPAGQTAAAASDNLISWGEPGSLTFKLIPKENLIL